MVWRSKRREAEILVSYSQQEVRNSARESRSSTLEGKEIDLVPFFRGLWCLWRLFSSVFELVGASYHSSLIILLVSIQICRSIVSGSSYYLNKGQI
jgi:hypothetical protein